MKKSNNIHKAFRKEKKKERENRRCGSISRNRQNEAEQAQITVNVYTE